MDIRIGDYVLATKYRYGDPRDPWMVGIYQGEQGFEKIEKISETQGAWLVDNAKEIVKSGKVSLWHYAKKTPCQVEGCLRRKWTKAGFCTLHYKRWLKHGDPNITLVPRKNS